MHKATATNSTLTIWDAIAPNRPRFTVVQTPAKLSIAQVIEAAAAKMGAFPAPLPLLPRSPYVNARGQMTDGAAHARWISEQQAGQHQAPAQPCNTPRERGSFSGGLAFCVCGHAMCAHNDGGR